VLVEQHHAVLLAADRDGRDAIEAAAPTRVLPGRPPVLRVDLGAAAAWIVAHTLPLSRG